MRATHEPAATLDVEDTSILIFDGACGTSIQARALPAAAWGGHEGCNEYLNISCPDVITAIHRSFVEAGADILETNTFGANRIVLADYGLQDRAAELNAAGVAAARAAAMTRPGVRVCGSIGPGTKLPLLDHVTVDDLAEAIAGQVEALVTAGVDLLLFETCQDLLQIKTGLVACFDTLARLGRRVPVMVSVTVETTGTLLTGSDVSAVVTALEPYPLFSLGLNCATGPAEMAEHVACLCRSWPGRVSVMPNAGLPRLEEGRTVYPLGPAAFAEAVRPYVAEHGVSIVGGCCGTTPEHIRALASAVKSLRPAARQPEARPAVSSVYQAADIRPEIPPFLVGERLNANGSKAFRELLLANDFAAALRLGMRQEAEGAMALDVCAAYAGRDECADLAAMVRQLRTGVRIPLMLDSTRPDCLEAALRLHPGRCIINSVNLEDGGANLDRICRLAKRYGAAVVALAINETGMAMTCDDKVKTAAAIHARALGHGLRPSDLLFDMLTFTLGSGDASLRQSAGATLEAIRRVKAELPGVLTILGVSNVSFGLPAACRKVLNSVFLHEAVEAGLDAAIIDVGRVLPLASIGEEERRLCLDLVHGRSRPDGGDALEAFIRHFGAARPGGQEKRAGASGPAEARLADFVLRGEKEGLDDLLDGLLRRYTAGAIINTVLVPAMRRVGALFATGEMLLPFVLQSAEVMKAAVSHLEPHMDKASRQSGLKVLLATVRGDVHDIGKNLVDIIFSNNGYTVRNLGIKVPAETIIEQARAMPADVIGLSGLLVKSALAMKEDLALFEQAGLRQPILLGGAALTPSFVAGECVPRYGAPVVYCADAFAGLKALREHEAGTLVATPPPSAAAVAARPSPRDAEISRSPSVPVPPFRGCRHVTEIPLERIVPYVNEVALFRGRWGYRRGKMSAAEYEELTATRVRPIYEGILERVRREELVRPAVAYGYFDAAAAGDTVKVRHGAESYAFAFPRQAQPPHLCIADYFRTEEEGGDVAGFFVATVGSAIAEATQELYRANRYHDYLMLHGFSVELTDALAEYWHEVMRTELGIAAVRPATAAGYATQEYQGSRYGFGYPACPDLEAHRPLFELLRPDRIGVSLTDTMQMVPEQTTSAIVVHHPQARYFAV